MMSGIRATNTKPELAIRRALHRKGFRYVLHRRNVPGCPDLVFPSRRAVVFVHGCFWHGHDCRFFRPPQTRPDFWRNKIARNRARDEIVREQLAEAGWRQLTVWECAIRGMGKDAPEKIAAKIGKWLSSSKRRHELRGP